MSAIEVEQITKTYKIGTQETHALRGVTASFNEGEFTALVGPSGSGKTTLLQIIGCLDQPTSGALRIKGQDVSRLNADQRADLRKGTIGFVFQFFALIPGLTAYENVELPLLLNGEGTAARKARVLELLDAVGLSERANHRPDQLSGGEQQRVAVARALSVRPLMVLADEPTANLDTENGKQVMEIMRRLNQETGVTFLFATHDPRVVSYATRVVQLRDGRIDDNHSAIPTV
ncbi:ABC transporter ATP-binding protein [Levilinea saccharolytica]|uniref:ABC transporter n=1 Tax=Levilinea saccharolytica TaxID=229921 RepID=A0A0N8GML8_9CHLR|nr:ABC transporter ATP-binding protein [Levilinea saccharolytica]KPL75658.1 ABC transporter [Levilinea saccharolytica]GAP16590.1 ABC-type antimicrobial peptide transport system, ATPase component [Levilinea saccharolytica]